MVAVAFPMGTPTEIMWHPANASRGGGVATNGMEQVVGSGSGRWEASGRWYVRTKADILAWRAFLAGARGRVGSVLLPAYDGKRANWPLDAQGRVLHPGFTRRRELDGTGYADPVIPTTSEINATVHAAAVLRATAIDIRVTQGTALLAGQYFGLGDRLYLIATAGAANGSGVQAVTFWPELRLAAAAGATVKITRPVCEMRLAGDDVGRLLLRSLRYGELSLDFSEAF